MVKDTVRIFCAKYTEFFHISMDEDYYSRASRTKKARKYATTTK